MLLLSQFPDVAADRQVGRKTVPMCYRRRAPHPVMLCRRFIDPFVVARLISL
ncbi:MAG: hypothetical protein NVV73_00590 [Cellvibrionaceae bacterium]|nr:hypothetical protein [Cellvibrionaceae bacterium]